MIATGKQDSDISFVYAIYILVVVRILVDPMIHVTYVLRPSVRSRGVHGVLAEGMVRMFEGRAGRHSI